MSQTNFQFSLEFDRGDGDRDRSLTSSVPIQKGVHPFNVSEPFFGKNESGFAVVHEGNKASFHWEEGEAFDALLNPEKWQADLIEIDEDGVAWE